MSPERLSNIMLAATLFVREGVQEEPVIARATLECVHEIERLHAWIDDLQSGMYINCVYCGHRYGPGDTTPATMADALKRHIAECPAHPMAECVRVLRTASHALKSYACGNSARDLAAEIAAVVDATIANATGAPKR